MEESGVTQSQPDCEEFLCVLVNAESSDFWRLKPPFYGFSTSKESDSASNRRKRKQIGFAVAGGFIDTSEAD
jgi:hypothetical protein